MFDLLHFFHPLEIQYILCFYGLQSKVFLEGWAVTAQPSRKTLVFWGIEYVFQSQAQLHISYQCKYLHSDIVDLEICRSLFTK